MTAIHCAAALIDGVEAADVRIRVRDGRIASIERGAGPQPGDLRLGSVVAGAADAHSHLFHRALRGRTHDEGGDFWRWRERMYRVAAALDPDLTGRLAEAVLAEMLVAGITAVGEFHYVHHRPGGTPYDDPNAIGRAIAAAAIRVGIRLVLLDALYLEGAPGVPLSPRQERFGDGDVPRYLERWHAQRDITSASVTLGAAAHSVRAVPPQALRSLVEGLPADVPVHIHLSEQPVENAQIALTYGATPAQVVEQSGLLSARLSVVHATHLTGDDVSLLGEAGVTAVFCPTTEADLGDGIGPARELMDAGARLALGSDQNAVIDPFLEVRALEAGERLRSLARGRITPVELDAARSAAGYAALGLVGGIRVGAAADLVEVDRASVRTIGARLPQLALVATASDVQRVVVGGRVVADRGLLADGRAPAALLRDVMAELDLRTDAEGDR